MLSKFEGTVVVESAKLFGSWRVSQAWTERTVDTKTTIQLAVVVTGKAPN